MKSIILSLLVSAIAAQQGPLPNAWLGTYELVSSEGFDDFMAAVGVNWLTRQIACGLSPSAKNSNVNGQIQIDTVSTFRSTSLKFGLNTPFQETTGDGRKVTTTATINGNKLVKVQKLPSDPSREVIETREFSTSGQFMRLTHTMPNKPNIRSVRVYKKKA